MKSFSDIIIFDFGSSTIKIAYLDKKNSINNILVIDNLHYTNEKRELIETTKKVKTYLTNNNLSCKNAGICISSKDIYIKIIDTPKINEEELELHINNYIQNNSPLTLQNIIIKYEIIEEDKTNNRYKILVAAAPESLVQKYINIINHIGLSTQLIIPNALLIQSLCKKIKALANKNILLIDFGTQKTNLTFVRDGNISFHRSLAIGGSMIKKELEDYYEISSDQSQKLIKQMSLHQVANKNTFSMGEKNPSYIIEPVLDTLATDIKRSIGYYINNGENYSLDQLYLYGGYANIPDIDKYLENSIGIKTAIYPITDPAPDGVTIDTINLHGFQNFIEQGNLSINLLPQEKRIPNYKEASKMKSSPLLKWNNSLIRFILTFKLLKSKEENKQVQQFAIGVLLLLIASFTGYYYYLNHSIASLENVISNNNTRINSLKEKADTSKKYKTQINEIVTLSNKYRPLLKNDDIVKIFQYFVKFDDLSLNFNRTEYLKNRKELHVIGEATKGENLFRFVKSLSAIPLIKNSEIIHIAQKNNKSEFELLIKLK